MAISLQNQIPASGAMGIDPLADIQVDIVSPGLPPLSLAGLEIYVEGALAFAGSEGPYYFHAPFIGPSSSVSVIADGFRILLDRTEAARSEFIGVQVRSASRLVGTWSFRVGSASISDFYLADGYQDEDGYLNPEPGIRRLHVRQLVGEWKPYASASDGYAMPVILSVAATPGWPSDIVRSLSSQTKDGYLFLVASTALGTAVTRNETADPRVHASGCDTLGGYMTAEGTLYLVNMALNGGMGGIEVYYGADRRPGTRAPDFVYDSSTGTPEQVRLLDGIITALHVAEGSSTVLDGGSRLYVGCASGLTKIEAYDRGTDGYCDGYDGYGRSYTYGIAGSPTDFPILGGTVPNVAAVESDETNGVVFVATNDGTETGGGLTQFSISRNVRLLFMTKESGHLPSNVIRGIASP